MATLYKLQPEPIVPTTDVVTVDWNVGLSLSV